MKTAFGKRTIGITCVAGAALATAAWSFSGGEPASAASTIIGPATVNAKTLPLYFTSATGNTYCSLSYDTVYYSIDAFCVAPTSTYTTVDPEYGRCRGKFSMTTVSKPKYECSVGDDDDMGNLVGSPDAPGGQGDWYYGSRPQYVGGDHGWLAPVLENGSTVKYGQLRCNIDASRVRCWDSKHTNNWFEFSRTSYRLSTGAHS